MIVSGLSAGDKVSIEATLSTSDPNENGEGEPLVLQSSSGFSVTIPEYELARALSFTATSDGESLSGFIPGFDGDEFGTVKISINASSGGFFSQDTKDGLHAGAVADGFLAAGSVATGFVFPPAEVFAAPFAAGVGLVAAGAELLSLDPSDPNFKVIVQPTIPSLPKVPLGPGVTQAEVDAFNRLMGNLENQIGIMNAALVSFNRATGAADAGDTTWVARQQQAGRQYLGQLGQLVGAEPNLLSNFVNALKSDGFPSTTVTPGQVLSMEYSVSQSGLPSDIVKLLQGLGADSSTIAHIGRLVVVQDINVVAGNYFDRLVDPAVISTLQQLSQTLLSQAPPLCKPGNGYGDTNHCHSGAPGQTKN